MVCVSGIETHTSPMLTMIHLDMMTNNLNTP